MVDLVVETGLGVIGANSYVDVAFADDYFASHPYYADNWSALQEERKKVLLIWGSAQVDALITWPGSATYELQGMGLPRYGWADRYGVLISQTTIPLLAKQAVCEMAMFLNSSDSNPDAVSATSGIEELKIDVIGIKFGGSSSKPAVPVAALRLLRALGVVQTGSRVRKVQVSLS